MAHPIMSRRRLQTGEFPSSILEYYSQLKELTEKKKEAGKAPRNSQAASNKFNVPIPKIRGGSTATNLNMW
jgi:hypothetical protein